LRQGESRAVVWVADNPFYTKRFAWLIGGGAAATIKDVAGEYHLHWIRSKTMALN